MNLMGSVFLTDDELQGCVEPIYEVRGKLTVAKFLQGFSAYEVAVINGFSGTEEEWLASLKGEKGDTGNVFDELTEEQLKRIKGDPGQNGERGSAIHIYAGGWYDQVPGTVKDDDGNSHAYIGRMKYENIVAQSQWEYLMVGDLVLWNSTLYPIVYIDPFADCAFMGEGVDIKGLPGANGTTPHIGANGNWFLGIYWDTGKPSRGEQGESVTVTKVTESSESGGSNVVEFSDGSILIVKNGTAGYTPKKGVDYFDGYTPVKGVDYVDGKDGYTPRKGIDYTDGYTPKKGVDYTDGEKGDPGEPGGVYVPTVVQQGIGSATIKFVPTNVDMPAVAPTTINLPSGAPGADGKSVTITKITESTVSGGSNIVEFSDGKKLAVRNGKDGKGGSGNAEQNEHAANLSNVGFIRTSNGSFTTTETGRRTDFIPTDGVTRISGVVGFYSACVTVGFYSAANQSAYLPDISIPGTAFLAAGANYGDGGFEIEIDLTDEKYADAKYFVVSSYRNTAQAGYYTLAVDFSDDYCKYANGEVVEEEPRYRISKNTVAFFGDSITAGGYPELIASITGATVSNHAVGGATVASGTANVTHIVEQIVAYTGNDDIICISGGYNDYWKNVPLGTLTAGYTDALDTTTVIGALERIFRRLLTNHTTAKLYYVITHKAASTEIKQNGLGLTFTDYHDAIVRVLEKYSVPFYDAFLHSGLITSDPKTLNAPWGATINSLYTNNADGEHPNTEGYMKYYVRQIIAMMEHR